MTSSYIEQSSKSTRTEEQARQKTLPERLRHNANELARAANRPAANWAATAESWWAGNKTLNEAADQIDSLLAERNALREALENRALPLLILAAKEANDTQFNPDISPKEKRFQVEFEQRLTSAIESIRRALRGEG